VHTVFIALAARLHERTAQLARQAHRLDRRTLIVPDLFELSLSRVAFSNMAGLPVFSVRDLRISRTGQVIKRLVDLGIVLALSPLVLFLTALLAVFIKLDSPGPVFFVQRRIGKDERPFEMIKFRSMVVDAEAQKEGLLDLNDATGPIFKIRNDPRLTRAGRFIRRLSLDELPQFYNVLLGEMSLVGPRPPLPEEVAQYQPWHRQRLAVKGGITGLWQVSGRSDLTFDEQCLLDIYYIENWSMLFDIRILIQTIPFTLFGRGAY
jgi:exopolysaccharide biosynthesis polyprenyl glycosylphosphotransferase